jgi:competence protein ComEC
MRATLYPGCWIVGVCLVQQLPALPPNGVRWGLWISACVAIALGYGWQVSRRWCLAWLCLVLGCLWTVWQADLRQADRLSLDEDNRVTRVTVLVVSLPEQTASGVRFIGEMTQAPGSLSGRLPSRFAKRVLIDWPLACTSASVPACQEPVVPGQHWRMALRFRLPHGRLNFHGFDTEAWLFERGIRATATVKGLPTALARPDTYPWMSIQIERIRDHIRARMLRLLSDQKESSVMVALAIGDQQGVSAKDWQVFNLTGITHLVSISGSHVTLIAALGAGLVGRLYRRMWVRGRRASERWPVRLVLACAAVVIALFYCLLAGWGVPARRTFFMLAAGALGYASRLPITGVQAVMWAAVVMTLLDPWSVLATGFWLSFGAVLILIRIATDEFSTPPSEGSKPMLEPSRLAWLKQILWAGARLQVLITLATTPVLAFLFHQTSLVTLAANAWAIPWVTFVATPLALLVSALCLLPLPDAGIAPLAWLAHLSLQWSLAPVRWLAAFPELLIELRAMPMGLLALALLGVGYALWFPFTRWRWLGWLLILPGLCWRPVPLTHGAWRMTAFDVGQGGAVLIQTQSETLLFDAGWQFDGVDAATRVILPELRALGIGHLDRVVISHPDMDHVGGLASLRQTRSIRTLIGAGLNNPDVQACQAGQSWQSDGVRFEFIHPSNHCASRVLRGLERNRCSCVLRVQGRWHSALLTGDIDRRVEMDLLGQGVMPAEVVLMAHHGSATSSSDPWVKALRAQHAIAQAGQYNRFGHPDQSVLARWQSSGAKVWVSAKDGAVMINSSEEGLDAQSARQARRRYWHRLKSDE